MSFINTMLAKPVSFGLSLLLSCVALMANGCAAQGTNALPNAAATNDWKRFVMMVWQYKTPEPGPEAKRLYESVNLRGIHLDDGFSDQLLNFAKQNNYPYYVDHAAGKGDLYLKREEWDAFVKTYRDNRSRPIRPRSIWDAAVRARMSQKLRSNITRAKTGPVLAYALDDEISLTSFTSPADFDWSPEGLARFRTWLQSEYGTLDKLNSEWDSRFAKWDDVEPKTVDDVRPFHQQPFDKWNLAPWMDHRRFMNTAWADLLADLTKEANALDPLRPAGFVGGQAPSTYGGFDYALLCDAVQWMEAYDIGGSNEILRSFWGQSKPHVQTYFLTESPAQDKWFLWYYLVHGNSGVICWPDTDKGPWFQNGTARDSVKALSSTFGEVQGPISEIFQGAKFQHDGIALYYSQPSIEASWIMDIQPHGRTWVNRSSSMNNNNATDILNRQAWMKLLEDSGFQYNFVSYRDIIQRGAPALGDYRVLILPRTFALSDKEAVAIREWVARGGTLIADYLPGILDEHGKGRRVGALDDVFGVQRESGQRVLNGKTIAEVNAELYDKPLAERLSYEGAKRDDNGFVVYERGLQPVGNAKAQGISEGAASGISYQFQAGRAYYANWSPLSYLLVRSDEGGQLYRSRIGEQLQARTGERVAPLVPRVRVLNDGKEMPLAERLFWTKNGKHYLCIVMNPLRQANVNNAGSVSGIVSSEPITINIEFRDALTGLKNERSGRVLGNGKSFSDRWVPCEANIYSW